MRSIEPVAERRGKGLALTWAAPAALILRGPHGRILGAARLGG